MKSKLIGNSIIFTGMTVIQKGMAFILLPLYTKFLSPDEYGIVNLVTSICAIYILILSLGLDDVVARYYFQYKNDKEKQKKVLGIFISIALVSSLLGTTVIILARDIILKPFVPNVDFSPYLLLGIIVVGCSSIYSILQKLLIIEEKAIHYSINILIFFIINTGLSIIFTVPLEMGAIGVLLASAITYVIFFIYSLLYLSSRMTLKIDKSIAISGLRYGGILLPNRIATWGLGSFNKVFLGSYISTAALGIYNIALQISSILTILANSFSLALQPWVYKQLENKITGKQNIKILIYVVSMIYSLVGLGISLFAKDLVYLFIDHRYIGSINIIPLLVLGNTIASHSSLFIYILFYYKNLTKYIAISTIIGASINIILSIALIPKTGIYGTAIVLTISNIVIGLIKSIVATSKGEIKINITIIYIFTLFCFVISMMVFDSSFWMRVVTYLAVCVLSVILNSSNIKAFMMSLRTKNDE